MSICVHLNLGMFIEVLPVEDVRRFSNLCKRKQIDNIADTKRNMFKNRLICVWVYSTILFILASVISSETMGLHATLQCNVEIKAIHP